MCGVLDTASTKSTLTRMVVVMMTGTDLELLCCHFKYAMTGKKRLND